MSSEHDSEHESSDDKDEESENTKPYITKGYSAKEEKRRPPPAL